MKVVLFTPRSGSTYTAKKLAQEHNLEYANEIFFSGPWPENRQPNYEEMYNNYFDVLINGLDKYKDAVVKITPQQIRNICSRKNIKFTMFFKMLKPHTSKFYFCVRENLSDQLKSLYALMALSNDIPDNKTIEEFAHMSWEGTKFLPHNEQYLEQAKYIIQADLEMLSVMYNKTPDDKKQLLIYENWANINDKYTREIEFEKDVFNIDLKLNNYFEF